MKQKVISFLNDISFKYWDGKTIISLSEELYSSIFGIPYTSQLIMPDYDADLENCLVNDANYYSSLLQLNGDTALWKMNQLLMQKYGQLIDNSIIPRVAVAYIGPNVGHGLFSLQTIPAGSYIGEYVGQVTKVTDEETINHHPYLFSLHSNNHCTRPEICPLSQYYVNPTPGNHTRFMNHSNNPNVSTHLVFHHGMWHVIFTAKTNISPNEQLFFDYGPSSMEHNPFFTNLKETRFLKIR